MSKLDIKKIDLPYYFKPVRMVDLTQLEMSNVSAYSITPWKEAISVSRTILNFFGANKQLKTKSGDELPIITDATANVGGNTISFFLSGFKKVNAIEIDEGAYKMLKNNLTVYSFPIDQVLNIDYVSIYKDVEQDVVFLDPPWGGPDYIKSPCLDLYLSDINIIDICFDLISQNKASLIVIKVPINYNLQGLFNKIPTRRFLTHKIYRGRIHSYSIIYCW